MSASVSVVRKSSLIIITVVVDASLGRVMLAPYYEIRVANAITSQLGQNVSTVIAETVMINTASTTALRGNTTRR